MRQSIIFKVRRQTWALSVFALVAFSWLGSAAATFGSIYQDFGATLSGTRKFIFEYGALAFPLFGLGAAIIMIVAYISYRRRWFPWASFAALVFAFFAAFSMMFNLLLPPMMDIR